MSAAGGINVKHLNSSISGCLDAEALMQLVEHHAASFDFIHASTALTRAAKLMEAPLSADEKACVAQLLLVAGSQLEQCGAWALANMACALAKLDYKDPAFMQQLVRQAGVQLPRFDAQGTANTLWALARLGYEDKAFTAQLMVHARNQKLRKELHGQEVSNILLATAKLQHVAEDRQLVRDLLTHAQPQLSCFTEQQLSNTAWALGRLRHYDQDFMEHLLLEASDKMAGFNAQNISNTLWALATFSHDAPAFVDAAIRKLLTLDLQEIKEQEFRSFLWALSMLKHNATPVVKPLTVAAAAVLLAPGGEVFRGRDLFQVHRWLVTMEGAGFVSSQLQASPQYQQLRRACHAAFLTVAQEEQSQPIEFTKGVLQAVRQLPGCSRAQAVQLTEDQQLTKDVCVTLPCGTKVAVEVELQTACMANMPDKPLGPLLWRRKQLAARGYKVVVVKQADWLEWGPEGQQMCLQLQFRGAGVVLPAK